MSELQSSGVAMKLWFLLYIMNSSLSQRLTFLEGSRITISSSSDSDSKPKLLNLDGFIIFLPDLELDMMLISDF